MKKFISMLCLILMLISLSGCGPAEATAYSLTYNNVEYTYSDVDSLGEIINEQISLMDAAHQMAEGARILGYPEEHMIIKTAKEEWEIANSIYQGYKDVYDKLAEKWDEKKSEYPEAEYIWSYLKALGYSDEVCAGILGNIMNETGGNTLAIQPTVSTNSYYGICQWGRHYPDVWGCSLEEQCDFLRDTIEYEIDTFGYIYAKGFDYQDFLQLKDSKKVALAFAKCYERCGSGSYKARQENAITAYNYFIS